MAQLPATHRARRPAHRAIGLLVLAAAIAVNFHTLFSALRVDNVNRTTDRPTPLEAAELAVVGKSLLGTYVTGENPGDRTITVQPGGRVTFAELGSSNKVLNNTDTFRLGRRASARCMVTANSGIIDIFDTDTLVYFRDFYRRK